MKIRILSDLHLDINKKYDVNIKNNDIFTLIAGDIGGDYKENARWLRENLKNGAFISGNHDAYTHDKIPIEDVKEFYHKEFPIDSNITYMDDYVGVISKELEDGTLLIADVLYTDYKLKTIESMYKMPVKCRITKNMNLATPKMSGPYLNDFMFFTRNTKMGYSNKYLKNNICYYITPEMYRDHFERVFKKITKIVEDNKDENIILMTHHCLSRKCIENKYTNDILNGSYVSEKDSWIKKHPNIRLIISGHVHHRFNFNIGKTLYVSNPLGYLNHFQNILFNKKTKKREFWSPDFFVDTETWKVETVPYNNKKWDKLQNENLALQSLFV